MTIPKRIGQYRIKRVIASGGMGTVYEAMQEQPRRTVAVKVMRPGVASRSALRRFEFESQLLARLQHAGIAQVYEAGTHDDGTGAVPFFAMEYIPNAKSITEYAKEKRLGTRDRLRLFAPVCDAVHHGHQKGIIHRDLKPGNILVDSHGVPKIIDFGVARATDSDLAVTTLQTDVGQLIGTVQYMSPEQCEADPHDIDTRSDVYALGVVLYELLAGLLPYDVTKFPVYQATQVVRERRPMRLSTIDRTLRGDIETVVFKALDKDRERRYQSADELRRDLEHYLKGEPISARPSSIAYQLRVFARRNKALFGAIAAVFIVLLAGAGVSTWQAIRASREAAITRKVNAFVSELLAATAPGKQSLQTAREVLDKASDGLDGRFEDEPLVEAPLRLTLANTYWELGEYEVALRHAQGSFQLYQAHLGEGHADTLDAMNTLAVLYKYLGRHDEAHSLYVRTFQNRRRVLGDEHADTLESMNNLAVFRWSRGRLDEAESLHREALAGRRRVLGAEHPDTLRSMANLATVLWEKGKLNEAESLAREALETRLRVLPEDHPDILQSMNNLARLLVTRGRLDEAEPLYRRALPTGRRVFGDEHPRVATILRNLADLLRQKNNDEVAEPLLIEAFKIRQMALGDEDGATLKVMTELGSCWVKLRKFEEAERILRDAYARVSVARRDEHEQTRVDAVEGLVTLYDAWGRPDQAATWRSHLSE
jgi:tetratricopeptide (TPR) repeat protein/tRNA A-37 threonylcarbamoyl transferase component Bud32